jgi:hypothetical protein
VYPNQTRVNMPIDIDLEWSVDTKGYRLDHGRIIGNGGKRRSYRVKEFPKLYTIFAKVKTPEDVLGFVHKFGRLTLDDLGAQKGIIGDSVKSVLSDAKMISLALGMLGPHMGKMGKWEGPFEYDVPQIGGRVTGGIPLRGKLTASLSPNPVTGAWELRLQPPTLLDAIWLQLGSDLTGNAALRACAQCGEWFEAGAGSGRRADAKFCSDHCRIEFNNQRRKKLDA